ncbi:hypothetical protein BFN67_08900 [Pseudaminobacter manganicus]|uniref:Uncharacterized protein n=2 Tax=Manganibacter manganicus TaxID=1873176 RepID=A0A1V8RJY1_9HYPH|nr:hypothetical protein BFN67_08900 [Pseudaminobacter manganicus]
MRVVEPHARAQKQDSRAEIAAKQELVGRRGLWAAADLPMSDLAEGFVETGRVWCRACRQFPIEDPGRAMGVDATDGDLVKQIEQTGRVCWIGACSPEIAYGPAQSTRQLKEAIPSLAPARGPLGSLLVFAFLPPDVAAGHFFVDTVLAFGDHLGEKW